MTIPDEFAEIEDETERDMYRQRPSQEMGRLGIETLRQTLAQAAKRAEQRERQAS